MPPRVKEASRLPLGLAAAGLALGLAPAAAQDGAEALRSCLRGHPTNEAAMIAPCTAALAAELAPAVRAQALANRAKGLLVREQPGDVDAALADLEAALRLHPLEDAAVTRALGRLQRGDYGAGLLERGFAEPAAALRELDAAIRADPRNPDLLWIRGAIRRLSGDWAGGNADTDAAADLWRRPR